MVAGWSTITSTVPNFALSLSNRARSFGSLLGSRLSKTFFPAGVRPVAVVCALADVQAEEDAHVADLEHRQPSAGVARVPGLGCGTDARASTLRRPAARELSGIAPGRTVAGPLISVSDGTSGAR